MASGPGHLIALHTNFRFVHEPLDCTNDAHAQRFVGRDDELEELVARILLSDGGAFLVTGYRGVGKSTFVNRVIQQVREQLREMEATLGRLELVDVYLNVPRAMAAVELMYHVLRALYLRLDSLHLLDHLDGSVRRDLELSFSRTSRTIALKTSAGFENTASVNFGVPIQGVAGSSSGFSFGTKRSAAETREMAYLVYDDKAAEYDLIHIARRLSQGFLPNGTARTWWHRLLGRDSPVTRLKVLLVFDELDKIEATTDARSSIDDILANLKTLFTTSGISFLFVAGKDIHERWLDDVGRGDSIYESVFSYALYLPPLWRHADPMCDPLLDAQAFGAVDAAEAATAYAAFKKFLAFNGRGIPRRILRKFNERVRWSANRAQLTFSRDDVRQFKFFADLYDVLAAAEATLFGELREDAWMGRTDRKRLGLYYLVDWILLRGDDEFTLQDAVAASHRLSRLIAPAEEAAPNIIGRLLKLLVERQYLDVVSGGAASIPPAPSAPESPPRYRLTHQRLVEMGSLAGVVEQEAQVVINESKQERFGGRYEVLSVLGRGGMSTVYLAQDNVLPRQVAIKEQLTELAQDPEARNRIRAEGRALSQLVHENIVRVYDVDIDAKQPYIVMEHVKGVRLSDLIGTDALQDEAVTLRIARQVVRALDFVHNQGILWRDPKPANIMITPEGRVVLLDFGISHLLASADRDRGLLLGTPTYSSPEQLRGEPLDVRSDVYCIGVVLYEMVSGRPPFPADTTAETISRRVNERPAPFTSDVNVSADLSAVIFKCLEPRKEDRFQTAADLWQALPYVSGALDALANAKDVLERAAPREEAPDEGTQLAKTVVALPAPSIREGGVERASLIHEDGTVNELRPPTMTIGRHAESDIRVLNARDVSRFHAELTWTRDGWMLADKNSRYGTLLNGTAVTAPVLLRHGDNIQLGRGRGATLVFHAGAAGAAALAGRRVRRGELGDWIDELRDLSATAPLERVLEVAVDRAIEVTGTERGFVMLADDDRALTFRMARARGRILLPGTRFETSRRIPEQVAATGEPHMVADLLEGDLPTSHMGTVALGIRQVICVPLRARNKQTPVGVLYLDSRERGMLFSQITRDALQLIALEVGDAIDRSRLEVAAEKARWEAARAIGAEIKRELVPDTEKSGPFFHVVGKVTPSRSVGGDVILVTELQSSGVAIAVGDVAGKGPAAALMASFLLGVMDAMVATHTVPREVVRAINAAMLSRQMESRFATMFYATLHADGALQYCNAGHNPPLIVSDGGIQRLETGGMVLGLFEHAPYEDAVIQLAPGDTVIAFSDGVTEARNNVGEEFSDERLVRLVQEHARESIPALRDTVLAELDMFRGSAPLSDDASLLVLRYRPIATS